MKLAAAITRSLRTTMQAELRDLERRGPPATNAADRSPAHRAKNDAAGQMLTATLTKDLDGTECAWRAFMRGNPSIPQGLYRVLFVISSRGRESGSDAIPLLRLILMFAAAGLALVTVFVLSAKLWWAFDLFSHFRLQYVVSALVLCGAALAVRAHLSAAVLAAVLLVHGWAIKDVWLGGSAEAASDGTPLRVVSANVLRSNPTPGKVLDFVRSSVADVVVLVDARGKRWQNVLTAIAADYRHRAPEGWREGAPVILFSRHPIVQDTVIHSLEGRRPHLAADLAFHDRTLTVVGVHPSSPSPEDPSETHQRNLQLKYLANIVDGADGPVIVAGDFNTTPWSPHFEDLVATTGLRNAADGHGYLATWPSWFWPAQIPIDHILAKGPVTVTNVKRGPAIGSDHYPIVADLRLVGG